MDWKDWRPLYLAISQDLSLDREKDRLAAEVLSALLAQNPRISDPVQTLRSAEELISGKDAYLLGAGPSLEQDLDLLISERTSAGTWGGGSTGNDLLIAADGATSAALRRGLVPQVIVSDLDGGPEDQASCISRGAIMFLHAHSDNVGSIAQFVPTLGGKVLGTTQVEPPIGGRVFDFGGFSDGDRAAFIAAHFGCRSICLIGFDLDEAGDKITDGGIRSPLDRASRDRKTRKLFWASVLMPWIKGPRICHFDRQDHR